MSMRKLPAAEQMERALLGSCLLHPPVIDDLQHVRPEHFYEDRHSLIWSTLLEMRAAGQAIDLPLLAARLDALGKLVEIGLPERDAKVAVLYLTDEVLGAVAHAAHAEYYAREVLKSAKRRTVIAAGQEVIRAGYDTTSDVDDVVSDAEAKLHAVLQIGQRSGPQTMQEILVDVASQIGSHKPRGIPTDWPTLDAAFLGWCPGHLVILAARPAMGKTAFALQVGQRVAERGRSVLVISIEMTRIELAERIVARNASVPEFALRKGITTPAQNQAMVDAACLLSPLQLHIDDSSRFLRDVLSSIRLMRRRHHIDLVVVDYLQIVENHRTPNREQQIAEISRALKAAAKENEVCVLALSQLNRSVEMREDKRPRLSDLRESGAIEQDADCVLMLHRPSVFDPEQDPRECQVQIAKQRAGPTTTVRLDFNGQYGSFSDVQIDPAIYDQDWNP